MNHHSLLKNTGKVRTDLSCTTECKKHFTALIDYDVDGNHKVYCPFCGHEHWRVVKNGVVTEDRFGSSSVFVEMGDVRKVEAQAVVTSSRSVFLRDRWLNREGV